MSPISTSRRTRRSPCERTVTARDAAFSPRHAKIAAPRLPPRRWPVLNGDRLRASRRTALPRRHPGCGGAWLLSRDDIDHDRSVGGARLLEGRGGLARRLDTDTAHAAAAGDRGKIGRPAAAQCLAAVRTIARNPVPWRSAVIGHAVSLSAIISSARETCGRRFGKRRRISTGSPKMRGLFSPTEK